MGSHETLFIGTRTEFSLAALGALLADAPGPVRVVIEDPRTFPAPSDSPLAVAAGDDVEALCRRHGARIDVVADAASLKLDVRPELGLVACYPRRLPPPILELPRRGCLNLHPSLLPAYRGPEPVFWQLRAGETRTGVTLHVMTEELDAGDIVAQASRPLAVGVAASQLERMLAEAGGALAAQTMARYAGRPLPRRPQDERAASYFPRPRARDFRLELRWSAERAYRFMRGTREWGRAYELRAGDRRLWLERAVDFDPRASLDTAVEQTNGTVRIRFDPGVLVAVAACA